METINVVNPVTGQPDPRLAATLVIDEGQPNEEYVAIDANGILVRFDGPSLVVVGPWEEWLS